MMVNPIKDRFFRLAVRIRICTSRSRIRMAHRYLSIKCRSETRRVSQFATIRRMPLQYLSQPTSILWLHP